MIKKWGITGDEARLFINTAFGCCCQCQYCYLKELGVVGVQARFKAYRLIQIAEETNAYIKGAAGTIISIGCYSECWDATNRKETIEIIRYFLRQGNYVQMSTKQEIFYEDLAVIEGDLKFPNQFFLFVSMPTITRSLIFEPHTESVERRINSLSLNKKLSICTVLYIKPVLENITINDLERYLQIIGEYKVPVVIGNYLKLSKKGDTTVGWTSMEEIQCNDVKKLKAAFQNITEVFEHSTDIIKKYKENGDK